MWRCCASSGRSPPVSSTSPEWRLRFVALGSSAQATVEIALELAPYELGQRGRGETVLYCGVERLQIFPHQLSTHRRRTSSRRSLRPVAMPEHRWPRCHLTSRVSRAGLTPRPSEPSTRRSRAPVPGQWEAVRFPPNQNPLPLRIRTQAYRAAMVVPATRRRVLKIAGATQIGARTTFSTANDRSATETRSKRIRAGRDLRWTCSPVWQGSGSRTGTSAKLGRVWHTLREVLATMGGL